MGKRRSELVTSISEKFQIPIGLQKSSDEGNSDQVATAVVEHVRTILGIGELTEIRAAVSSRTHQAPAESRE